MNDDVGNICSYVSIMNDDKIIIVKIKTKNYFYAKKSTPPSWHGHPSPVHAKPAGHPESNAPEKCHHFCPPE